MTKDRKMSDSVVPDGPPPAKMKLKKGDRGKSYSSSFMEAAGITTQTPEEKLKYYQSSFFEEEDDDLPPLPSSKRKCTDILFLLMFLIYGGCVFCVAMYAYAHGDPRLLIYGTDNEGRLCGTGNFSDAPFLVWPRFSVDVFDALFTNPSDPKFSIFGVCQTTCPQEGDLICSTRAEDKIQAELDATPSATREQVIHDCIDDPFAIFGIGPCTNALIRDECFDTLFNTTGLLFRCFPEFVRDVEVLEDESGCTKRQNFTDIFGTKHSRCVRFRKVTKITEEEPTDTDLLFETYNTAGRFASLAISDVYKTLPVIGAVGLGVSTGLGLIYVSAMWFFVGVVVWTAVIMSVVVMILFTLYCYFQAGIISGDALTNALATTQTFFEDLINKGLEEVVNNETKVSLPNILTSELPDFISENADYSAQYENGAYILTVLTALLLLIVLFIFPKIVRAIEFFKEASKALRANLDLLVIPPLSAALLLVNAIFFLFSMLYMLSTGDIVIKELNISVGADDTLTASEFQSFTYMQAFAVFLMLGFFWATNMINGLTTLIISNVIAQSYWGGQKRGLLFSGYGSGNLFSAIYITLRYHIGTVAFGSLLIAIVQVVRYLAAFIEQRTKKVKQDSRVVKILFISIHCFLRCAEKCVEFISSSAYIMTAMYGTSFCKSSRMAFFAIAHNLAQVATVSFLGDIILRFGQILITVTCGLITFLVLDRDAQYALGGKNELFSFLFPVGIVMILAWVIAGEVLNIYDIAVDTILLSYCQDRKRLDLRGKNVLQKAGHDEIMASKNLQEFIDKHKINETELSEQKTLYMVN